MQISPSKLTKWRCGGASVLGASHVRQGAPNQDAIAWWPETGQGLPLILAIADGHGSAKSFRSQLGAAQAVQTAIAELTDVLQLQDPQKLASRSRDLQKLENALQQNFPEQLVRVWQDQVQQHLQAHPFTDAEWQKLKTKDGETACQLVQQNPLLAYGATLLAVVVAPQFMLYLQLGDGDILCVNRKGQSQRPLPVDPDLIANETTSLCMPHAWDWLRLQLTPIPAPDLVPNLILLSTDGYANSFVSEADFCQVGPDYQQMLQELGFAGVMAQLPDILQETSQQGSGDDITLGLIFQGSEGLTAASPSRGATFLQNKSIPNPQKSQTRRPGSSTGSSSASSVHQVPGRTRLATSAHTDNPATNPPKPAPNSTRFQSPPSASPPTVSPPAAVYTPEPALLSSGPDPELQQLQQTNQQLQKKLKWLQLGLFLSLGATVFSVGVAALALWLGREKLPIPGLAPAPASNSEPSPAQSPGQNAAPGNSSSESPTTDEPPANSGPRSRPERRERPRRFNDRPGFPNSGPTDRPPFPGDNSEDRPAPSPSDSL